MLNELKVIVALLLTLCPPRWICRSIFVIFFRAETQNSTVCWCKTKKCVPSVRTTALRLSFAPPLFIFLRFFTFLRDRLGFLPAGASVPFAHLVSHRNPLRVWCVSFVSFELVRLSKAFDKIHEVFFDTDFSLSISPSLCKHSLSVCRWKFR